MRTAAGRAGLPRGVSSPSIVAPVSDLAATLLDPRQTVHLHGTARPRLGTASEGAGA
jgi:hypothetical protein